MGSLIKHFQPVRVDSLEVAPHRYTWRSERPDPDDAPTYREFIAAVAYKEGEVVYIEGFDSEGKPSPTKARILGVFRERDTMGFFREKYRIQRATKKGLFSQRFEYTHPGFIQRGYQQAGLAPDIDLSDRVSKAYDLAERERKAGRTEAAERLYAEHRQLMSELERLSEKMKEAA